MSTSTTRGHRNWQAGEVFSAADATDLYEVARWGKGYFSISTAGHVLVHPTKDPARAIDLKQLTDHLVLRGIQLPVLTVAVTTSPAVGSGPSVPASRFDCSAA